MFQSFNCCFIWCYILSNHYCSFVNGDSIQMYPKELYFGGSDTQVILTCQPSQSCGDTIKWFYEGTKLDTSSSKYSTAVNYINNYQTLTVNNPIQSDAGSYHCQCTFNGVFVNSPTATVIHIYPVSFTTPNNQVYHEYVSSNVTLICDIHHYENFEWHSPLNTVIPDNSVKYQYSGTNLVIKNLTLSDTSTYYCVGNNQVTFIAKLAVHLKVYFKPVIESLVYSVDDHNTVILTCTVSGYPLPNVSWTINNHSLHDNITTIQNQYNVYTITSIVQIYNYSHGDDGVYYCMGYNGNGSTYDSIQLDRPSSIVTSTAASVISRGDLSPSSVVVDQWESSERLSDIITSQDQYSSSVVQVSPSINSTGLTHDVSSSDVSMFILSFTCVLLIFSLSLIVYAIIIDKRLQQLIHSIQQQRQH